MKNSQHKNLKVLVLSTRYPLDKDDYQAIFLKTLYEQMAEESPEVEIELLAADHMDVQDSESPFSNLNIIRFQYWFRKYQNLFYHEAFLSNIKQNKHLLLMIPAFFAAIFFKGVGRIWKNRPDVIHAHWAMPCGFVGVLLSKLFRIPLVVTSHGGDVYGLNKGLPRHFLKFVYSNAHAINPVSRPLAEEIAKIVPKAADKIWVKSMGVNTRNFYFVSDARQKLGIPAGKKLVLFVGRLAEVKGVRYLIEAFDQMQQKRDDLIMYLIGIGNLEKELKNIVTQKGLDDRITFLGSVMNKELLNYYSACDVLVQPSVPAAGGREGVPVTLMEALICHANIVASRIGGMATFAGFRNITLVEPGNVEEIAAGVLKMATLEKAYNPAVADQFKIENVAIDNVGLYRKILGRPHHVEKPTRTVEKVG